jgi:hypothetical protein
MGFRVPLVAGIRLPLLAMTFGLAVAGPLNPSMLWGVETVKGYDAWTLGRLEASFHVRCMYNGTRTLNGAPRRNRSRNGIRNRNRKRASRRSADPTCAQGGCNCCMRRNAQRGTWNARPAPIVHA